MTRRILQGIMALALAMVASTGSAGTHSRGAHYDLSDKSLHGGGTVTGDIIFSGACASYQDVGTNDGFVCCADGCYGLQRGADEDPTNIVLSSEDAWSQATVNTSGGDLVLAAGLGRRLITVTGYTLGSTDTVTLTVNGSATVLTEGTEFDCIPTSNAACATSLATAIDTAAVGLDATASSAVVYIDKVAGSYVRTATVAIADGGVDGAFGTATQGDDGTIVCEHNLTNLNAIEFDTTPTHTHTEGGVHWNADDKTLNIDSEVSGTSIQVGQEIVLRATNKTGAQIDDGTVVYIDTAQGSRPTIAKADADLASSCKTIGLATHDIADNATGYVTTFGMVRDVDTSGTPVGEVWADGDVVYLSQTAGAMTKTRPAAPAHGVRVGYVLFANAGSGIVFVSTLLNAATYHAIDATGVDTMTVSHNGTDGVIESQVGGVNIASASGAISMSDDDVSNVGDANVDSITPDSTSWFGGDCDYIESDAANPADATVLRLGNGECIAARNNANSDNLDLCFNASDQLTYEGAVIPDLAGAGVQYQVVYHNDADTLTSSANMTFNGSALAVTGSSSLDGAVVINDSSADVDFRVESNGNANMLFVDGGNDGVGIGTGTVPHGGVGAAILAAEGTDSSTNGPHVQFTTATDDYPVMQFRNWSHDDVAILFDAYYDGAWKSSDAGSNFRIRKTSDVLSIAAETGIAAGSGIPAFTSAIDIGANASVVINEASAAVDTRIESDNNDGMLVVDGTNDRVGIGTKTPSTLLHLSSTDPVITLTDADTGVDHEIDANSGQGRLYIHGDINDEGTLPGVVVSLEGSANERLNIISSVTVVNEASADVDFRVESNGNANMLFVDGGTDGVGIGTGTPQNKLDVEGAAVIGATYSGTNTAPTNGLLVEGDVGIGTTTVPHGAVGAAMLALDGTNGNNSGPHIQATTDTDDYPVFQQLNWAHDNINLCFDCYFDGAWKSSDAGSNFRIEKYTDIFQISVDSGIAAGAAVTLIPSLSIIASGEVGIINSDPSAELDVIGDIENEIGTKGAITTRTGAESSYTCANVASYTFSSLIPDGAFLLGVSTRVTTALTGPTDYDVGDGSTVNLYADAAAVALGTTTDNTDAQANWSNPQLAAGDVVVTFNGGNCTAGVIYAVAHYFTITAPDTN